MRVRRHRVAQELRRTRLVRVDLVAEACVVDVAATQPRVRLSVGLPRDPLRRVYERAWSTTLERFVAVAKRDAGDATG